MCRKSSKGKKNPLCVSNTSERQPAAITTPHEKKWTVGGGASRNRVTLIKRKEKAKKILFLIKTTEFINTKK